MSQSCWMTAALAGLKSTFVAVETELVDGAGSGSDVLASCSVHSLISLIAPIHATCTSRSPACVMGARRLEVEGLRAELGVVGISGKMPLSWSAEKVRNMVNILPCLLWTSSHIWAWIR